VSPDQQAAHCEGKEPFRERRYAEQAAKRVRRNSEARTDVYRCPNCQHFHIGRHLRRKTRRAG
jgi:ribosomal protein L37AE/L43A